MANERVSGLAIASLILGIISVMFMWVPVFGWIFIILALVFGFVALRQTRANKNLTGKGMAIAGIVLGFVALAVAILMMLLVMAVFISQSSPNSTQRLNTTISPAGVTGIWAGSATLTNNCANPACEYIGSMNPPTVTLNLVQNGNTVTGTINLNLVNVKALIQGQGCQALQGQGAISNGQISSTRLTFNDPSGNFWSLNVISRGLQGTVSSDLPGCTGFQTRVGASNPVSLTRQ